MVTQNGDSRYYPPRSHEGITGTPDPRRRAPPRPLENLRNVAPGQIPPDGHFAHSPRAPYSPRFQPAPFSPRQQLAPSRGEGIFLPPGSPTLQYGNDASFSRVAFRSPTYPTVTQDQSPQWSLGTVDPDRPPPPRRPPGRPGLRISMSTSRLNSRRPQLYGDEHHQVETSPHGLGLPRFPAHVSPDLQGDDPIIRDSLNSAMTSRSSAEQVSGTERSSVVTKSSSITDLSPDTPDGPYAPYEKDEGMSVEDAISMYLDGFSDVPEEDVDGLEKQQSLVPEEDEPDLTSDRTEPDEEFTRRSESILEAMNTSMGAALELPDPEPQSRKPLDRPSDGPSKTPPQETVIFIPGVVPPPLLTGTGARDRYGFRKATHHVTLAQYDSWNGSYANFQEHRRLKWSELLKENGLTTVEPTTFPPKSSKIKRYVRKGIPSEYRGSAWFWYAGGFEHLHRNPGHYAELVERAMESPTNDDKEHIERDLHRTFPDNIHFKPEMPDNSESEGPSAGSSNPKYSSDILETEMIQSLRRVLYAFSFHNPKIGYTQSLNFITGLLLLFLPEEKAFWMLHIITSVFLPGTHEISLEGANVDLWILMVLLRESLPSIYTKVASAGPTTARSKPPAINVQTRLPDVTLGLTNWLMSLFIGSLPLETTLRVWDVFFYEGSKTFFRVGLAIFKASEKEILSVSDPMEVFQIVQTVPKKLLDANSLLDECFARRYRVGQGRVDTLRAARRAAVREEKLRRSMMAGKGPLHTGIDARPTTSRAKSPLPGLERGLVDSWRNVKHHAFK